MRIGEAYNMHHNKNYLERKPVALKCRWHKINYVVQKLARCYKQVVATQKDEYEKLILVERAISF